MDGLIINGQVYYVRDMRDFLDLVRDKMSNDSANWLEEHLEDEDDSVAELLDMMDTASYHLNEALDALHYC